MCVGLYMCAVISVCLGMCADINCIRILYEFSCVRAFVRSCVRVFACVTVCTGDRLRKRLFLKRTKPGPQWGRPRESGQKDNWHLVRAAKENQKTKKTQKKHTHTEISSESPGSAIKMTQAFEKLVFFGKIRKRPPNFPILIFKYAYV